MVPCRTRRTALIIDVHVCVEEERASSRNNEQKTTLVKAEEGGVIVKSDPIEVVVGMSRDPERLATT